MLPVSLAALERNFPEAARVRGERYFQQGRVHLSRTDRGTIAAEVRGSRRYDASLRFDERSRAWQIACTCEAFASLGPCKHLWATLQAARAVLREGAEPEEIEAWDDPRDESDPEPVDDLAGSAEPWAPPLGELRALAARSGAAALPARAIERRLRYVLDASPAAEGKNPIVHVLWQRAYKRGGWSEPRSFLVRDPLEGADLPSEDRAILALLRGASGEGQWTYGTSSQFGLQAPLQPILLSRMAATGRLHLANAGIPAAEPLRWDADGAWEFGLALARREARLELQGFLARGTDRLALEAPLAVLSGGIVVHGNAIGAVDWRGAWECAAWLRRTGTVAFPREREGEVLGLVGRLPGEPRLEAEGILREVGGAPAPHLLLDAPRFPKDDVRARVEFAYESERVRWRDDVRLRSDGEGLFRIRRDAELEQAAVDRLLGLGARLVDEEERDVATPVAELPALVSSLLEEGWRVEAQGRPCRSRGSLALSIRSGIDWFDLSGAVAFGDARATLPDLLRAIQAGERMVPLSDGSFGMMPEAWIRGWDLAGTASEHEGTLRFRKNQAWLLDLLLAERGSVDVDAAFERARTALRRFERFEPALEPEAFRGELRAYQREGLGWLHLLRELGLGGCLADDMGLGKTVQVLALLAETPRARRRPALVVAPRSVVFNWLREAERFVPDLSVHAHHGVGRSRDAKALARHDLVVTTYGTLRRDVELLARIPFEHAILDEAQAIKNPASQSAKAARLLVADHRLALTGTPVENHLDDLWSLFEFLNPGMLGRSRVFSGILAAEPDATGDSTRALARALRPFLLRRTKEEVLKELPPKIEQVIACDLEGEERRRYDELRDHYRASLLGRADEEGWERIRMHVLEALLRLRQAACHPGLIDRTRTGERSAKLDALLPMLEEVRESGHKALVFSQFTSFLAIVRARLEAAGVPHAYLDGQSRDREESVRRFQEDAACPCFLISLKAGGFGLNLAAADYVFLLDPWWNPAVERQAIDRTHRIGQTRTVNAYRLVARDTIEEKVLELQEKKRVLAEAILGEAQGTLRDLTREDLERLLS